MSKELGGRLFLSTKRTIPSQDAIKRRFNRVLPGFAILSILFRLGTALGLALSGVGQLERN